MLSLMNKLWNGARSQCPGVLLILSFFIVCRTFLHNMRAFGLNIEWCLEFLRKQSTIGNLSEGNYFIILLKLQLRKNPWFHLHCNHRAPAGCCEMSQAMDLTPQLTWLSQPSVLTNINCVNWCKWTWISWFLIQELTSTICVPKSMWDNSFIIIIFHQGIWSLFQLTRLLGH